MRERLQMRTSVRTPERNETRFAVRRDPPRPAAAPVEGPPASAVVRPGGALPPVFRNDMERAFQTDFSAVRVHSGPAPERLGAVAFTRGSDLYFAPGAYDPASRAGRELIAHELTHVVQQGHDSSGSADAPEELGRPAIVNIPSLEFEARRLGGRAVQGEMVAQEVSARSLAGRPAIIQCSENSKKKVTYSKKENDEVEEKKYEPMNIEPKETTREQSELNLKIRKSEEMTNPENMSDALSEEQPRGMKKRVKLTGEKREDTGGEELILIKLENKMTPEQRQAYHAEAKKEEEDIGKGPIERTAIVEKITKGVEADNQRKKVSNPLNALTANNYFFKRKTTWNASHLIASIFGGDERPKNLIPTQAAFNNGDYKTKFENPVSRFLSAGQNLPVTLHVTVSYPNNDEDALAGLVDSDEKIELEKKAENNREPFHSVLTLMKQLFAPVPKKIVAKATDVKGQTVQDSGYDGNPRIDLGNLYTEFGGKSEIKPEEQADKFAKALDNARTSNRYGKFYLSNIYKKEEK